MTYSEYVLAGAFWGGVILIQVTLIALLGLLAWLAARRWGPALRGACLLAGLVGVLLTPVLALVAPVWLPLPEYLCPINASKTSPPTSDSSPTPRFIVRSGETSRLDAELVVMVTPPPAKTPLIPEEPTQQGNDTKPAKATPVVVNMSMQPEEVEGIVRLAEPVSPLRTEGSSIAGMLAALWLLGTLVCLIRALVRLSLLYRVARQARPIRDPEWLDCAAILARRLGLPAVELREIPAVCSPLTLGLLRPVILLPAGATGRTSNES